MWEIAPRAAAADRRPRRRRRTGREPTPRLCFECATDRRELTGYPAHWRAMSPDELDALCREARSVYWRPALGAFPVTRPLDVPDDEL